MKVSKYLTIVFASLFIFAGCTKELSFESGPEENPAAGSLQSELGNCMPVTVKGNYVRNKVLTDSNNVIVQVNFSAPGRYVISTDTSNGFSFTGSGVAADSGLQNITLTGVGTPLFAQQTDFTVTFDSTACLFLVNVLDSAIIPPVTSGDYFPTTDSSNWTYSNSAATDTIRVQVKNTDIQIGGNNYRIFTNTYGPGDIDSSFYRKGGGLYYTYGDLNEFGIFDEADTKIEYIFLKDNVAQNATWETPEVNATFGSIQGKAKIRFTIAGKDIQTTIGITAFDSVIQVQREYMFAPLAGSYLTIVTGDFYYAKNIGSIKAETAEPFPLGLYVNRWEIYF